MRASDYRRARAPELGLRRDLGDLRLLEIVEGLSAVHVRYQQTFGGVPVVGGTVSVSLPKGEWSRPMVLSRYRAGIQPVATTAAINDVEAVALATRAVSSQKPPILRGTPTAESVYALDGGRYVLAWQVLVPALDPLGSWLLQLRADNGRLLLKENVLRFDGGRVFDPNPAKTSAAVPQVGQAFSSPTRYPWFGQTEKVGVRV